MEKETEIKNFLDILREAQKSLQENDALKLKELSDRTIHSASIIQDTDSITIAILVYSLSKLIERKDKIKIRNWNRFVKKLNTSFYLAEKALEENRRDKVRFCLAQARKTIASLSPNLKPMIQEVFRKASINKASRIYEHGISMEQTAKLLGITQWELSEYAGQTKIADVRYNITLDVKQRANMALEFFR